MEIMYSRLVPSINWLVLWIQSAMCHVAVSFIRIYLIKIPGVLKKTGYCLISCNVKAINYMK
jgi:hypothetical protein